MIHVQIWTALSPTDRIIDKLSEMSCTICGEFLLLKRNSSIFFSIHVRSASNFSWRRDTSHAASMFNILLLGGLFFKYVIGLAFSTEQNRWKDYKIIQENRYWYIQFRYVIKGSRLPKLPKIGSRTTGWLCELGIVEYQSSHFAKIRLTRRRPWDLSIKIRCLRNREYLLPNK